MTTQSASNDRATIDQLRNRVASLTAVIYSAIEEDTSSLASRYMQEKMDRLNAPNVEKIGRQEMLEEVISLVYERYFMYNRNFHGVNSDRTIQMKNLIHDLREMQAQEMA
jgi:hypothetical protein